MQTLFIIFLVFLVYFFPALWALSKKKRNWVAILLLNLFLGWSIIGWVIALVWAATNE